MFFFCSKSCLRVFRTAGEGLSTAPLVRVSTAFWRAELRVVVGGLKVVVVVVVSTMVIVGLVVSFGCMLAGLRCRSCCCFSACCCCCCRCCCCRRRRRCCCCCRCCCCGCCCSRRRELTRPGVLPGCLLKVWAFPSVLFQQYALLVD